MEKSYDNNRPLPNVIRANLQILCYGVIIYRWRLSTVIDTGRSFNRGTAVGDGGNHRGQASGIQGNE